MTKADGLILARWQTILGNTDISPLDFFGAVQAAVEEKELSDVSFSYITRREGGWFSSNRVYLRICCGRLFFDVSAFIVGSSLIIGWWLHEYSHGVADLLAEIPVVGLLVEKTTRAATYYAVDFIEHFQRAVHDSILQVVDELSEENGLTYLSAEARQPVQEEIW